MKNLQTRLKYFRMAVLLVTVFTISAMSYAQPGYGTTNLALGKPITPLTGTSLGSPAGVADGSIFGSSSYWYSYNCSGWSPCINRFTIDLGVEHSIGKINAWPLQTGYFTLYSSSDGINWTPRHQYNWINSSGLYVAGSSAPLTFFPNGAYSARYLKWEGTANWNQYVGMQEFEVYEWMTNAPPEPDISSLTNLALGKPAQNYSTFTSVAGHAPSMLTDGNVGTFWQGNSAYDQCGAIYQSQCPLGTWYSTYGGVVVDLGSPQPIQAVRLKFPSGAAGAQSYFVVLADDANGAVPYKGWTSWGDPSMIASNPTVTSSETRTFYWPTPVSARFVYVIAENVVTRGPLPTGLAELEVFGELPAGKQDQTISFDSLSSKIYGDPDFDLLAVATSGLPVSFTAAGDCIMAAANIVHITGAGSCTITASQVGDSTYNPAPNVPQTFSIAQASSTTVVTCGAGPFYYTGAAQEPCIASYSTTDGLNGPLAVGCSDNINAGNALASAAYSGDSNHSASSSSATFTINRVNPTCTVLGYDVHYDGLPHTAAGSCVGILGEALAGLDLSMTTHTAVGSYPDNWTFTPVATSNYTNAAGSVLDRITFKVPTNKDECKNGGWQFLARPDGTLFRNQGDCIQFVNTGK